MAELIANSSTRSLNISLHRRGAGTVNLLHILERIPARSVLEHLQLHLTFHLDTIGNHQTCQEVYGHVQQINNNRSTEGIINPLIIFVHIESTPYGRVCL